MKTLIKISIVILVLLVLGLTGQSQNTTFQSKSRQVEVHDVMGNGLNLSQYVQGIITVKLKAGVGEFGKQTGTVRFGIPSLDDKVAKYEVYQLEKRFRYNPSKLRDGLPDLSRIYKISFPDSISISEVVESFLSDPNVEYAEPVPVYHTDEVPNDALYSQMQHLPQIFAPEAWAVHKGENGTEEIVIAINDVGVEWDHVDLRSNVWQNLLEDADEDSHTLEFNGTQWVLDPGDLNGIDDDGNGFTDDLIGWNFITSTGDPKPIPGNPGGDHGTHCAGISNGVTNNGIGISSISWNLSLMAICDDQYGSMLFAFDGIIYAAENGADIISNSWHGDYSIAGQEVVTYATGLGSIVVASAGNDYGSGLHYPSDYQGVISVASVSADDTKASYSNYSLGVDIAAPGGGSEGGILSTYIGNTYALMSGTSMATPLVAGCFGLLKSYHPDWSNGQLITQLLGTADNIDSLNPDYVNMLGSGRVNAYRMLTEENVMPFLKLELVSVNPEDENGNNINEPGEIVALNFNLHNYMPCYGAENVNVSITTEDPDITIINGTCTVNIPPDDSFSIEDQFQVQVSQNSGSHYAQFTLHFASDIPISVGQDINFEILVAPSGIFVFEGEQNGQDYSGTFITNILEHLDFDYTYSNTYPATLLGFETAFLSHGNFGQNQDKGTMFTEDNSIIVQEFLENGGNLYIEMGGMFYKMVNSQYPNLTAMKQLFGVNSCILANVQNPVDSLIGVDNAPTEGMVFTGSDQVFNWRIDKLIPASGAIIPFYENNYGNVSVMKDGTATYGQKAFYLSYSLAGLHDRDTTSSRNNVLLKTMDFFGYSLPQGYLLSNFITDKKDGASHLQVHFTDISISDPAYPITSWQWDFDEDGNNDSYDQNPVWTYNESGAFDVKLITSNGLNSDTLVMEGFITVNNGYLVYEGVPDGDDYSGLFIRDYLLEHDYTVTYRNVLPENLAGFSTVFLSFGNFSSGRTIFDNQMASTVMAYLQAGGYVYLEGGDALGYDQATNGQLLQMFGLVYANDGTDNPINSLVGKPDALTNGMLFNGNSQVSNNSIDLYVPTANADAAFVESGYGTVAVQQNIPDGRRTFCFSYSLSDLNNGEIPNTREELLNRILNFFNIYTATPNVEEPITMSCDVYPNPIKTNAIIRYYLPEESHVILEIFNSLGREISLLTNTNQAKGEHFVEWNTANLPTGIYFYHIVTDTRQAAGGMILVK
jgi:serine protease